MARLRIAIPLHNAKIGQQNPAVVCDQDIGGLHVPVHQSAHVEMFEGIAERQTDAPAARIPLGGGSPVELVEIYAQLSTLDIFHCEKRPPEVGAVGTVGNDSRMRKICERPTLTVKSPNQRIVRVVKPLDGDPFPRFVSAKVDRRHGSASKEPLRQIRPDLLRKLFHPGNLLRDGP